MKKSAWIYLFLAILLIGFASAANGNNTFVNNTSGDNIDKAYSCLRNSISNKSSLSLQEAVFSTLALGSIDKVKTEIENEKGKNCWPKSRCGIKDTAQVLLAYNRINKNSDDIEKWLIGQNATVTDLTWYIEIDTENQIPASCTIKYGSATSTINIDSDMKLSGSGGTCLSVSSNGYWLTVTKSANCMKKTFEISCDQDFVTSTLYQKNAEATVFISSETQGAASLGTTQEKVGAKCFKSGGSCNYEGTLWATIALKEKGYDMSDYMPYILAFADDNTRYFPSAFIYMLTGRDDQYGLIVQSQKQNKYWEMVSTPYNRYYDSALGMLSLVGTGSAERDSAKNYFSSIQTSLGCWNNNNIRDTAFMLYAGWQKGIKQEGSAGETTEVFCQDVGKYCEKPFDCTDSGGIVSSETCPGLGDKCCSVKVEEETCSQKNGNVCRADESCSLAPVQSADGSCCLGNCEKSQPAVTECESNYGVCKIECGSNEDTSVENCGADSGLVCCKTKTEKGGIGFWGWLVIILLIILIILTIVAIIFRDKIKIWWFKRKNKGNVRTVTRPGVPPGTRPTLRNPTRPTLRTRPLTGRGIIPGAKPSFTKRPPVKLPQKSLKDKELEETLKKLRDMGK